MPHNNYIPPKNLQRKKTELCLHWIIIVFKKSVIIYTDTVLLGYHIQYNVGK